MTERPGYCLAIPYYIIQSIFQSIWRFRFDAKLRNRANEISKNQGAAFVETRKKYPGGPDPYSSSDIKSMKNL